MENFSTKDWKVWNVFIKDNPFAKFYKQWFSPIFDDETLNDLLKNK